MIFCRIYLHCHLGGVHHCRCTFASTTLFTVMWLAYACITLSSCYGYIILHRLQTKYPLHSIPILEPANYSTTICCSNVLQVFLANVQSIKVPHASYMSTWPNDSFSSVVFLDLMHPKLTKALCHQSSNLTLVLMAIQWVVKPLSSFHLTLGQSLNSSPLATRWYSVTENVRDSLL